MLLGHRNMAEPAGTWLSLQHILANSWFADHSSWNLGYLHPFSYPPLSSGWMADIPDHRLSGILGSLASDSRTSATLSLEQVGCLDESVLEESKTGLTNFYGLNYGTSNTSNRPKSFHKYFYLKDVKIE